MYKYISLYYNMNIYIYYIYHYMLNIIKLYIYITCYTNWHDYKSSPDLPTLHRSPTCLGRALASESKNFVLGRLWGDERAILMGIYSW